MNRNEYRRALIMLRSLKTGVSGYVRLERRTLMGTLQFTVNGADASGDLYAALLYRSGGSYSAIKAGQFTPPRYGQTGLVWKFDPRNIEGRTLEQYDLAAVIEIRNGVCELLLCGNLNGSVETDWLQVREAACRLFSPVRISGAPISPIDERPSCECRDENDGIQTLPEYGEQTPSYPGSENAEPIQPRAENHISSEVIENDTDGIAAEESSDHSLGTDSKEPAKLAQTDVSADLFEMPADEFDVPAQDASFDTAARASVLPSADTEVSIAPDELDTPAQDDFPAETTAGELLALSNPEEKWPSTIEPVRTLFFSSEAIVPFETDGYVFIRAPLHEDCGVSSCLIGLYCENGRPERVCYAIPAAYTPEPPAGLEGYVWQGDRTRGYWVVCENVNG